MPQNFVDYWKKIQAFIISLLFLQLPLLQLMFPNHSPFQDHPVIMELFMVAVFLNILAAVAAIVLQTFTQEDYFRLVSHFSIVFGTAGSGFLFLIVAPAKGCLVLALCTLLLLYTSLKFYKHIWELLKGAMAWIVEQYQSIWQLQENSRGDNNV